MTEKDIKFLWRLIDCKGDCLKNRNLTSCLTPKGEKRCPLYREEIKYGCKNDEKVVKRAITMLAKKGTEEDRIKLFKMLV